MTRKMSGTNTEDLFKEDLAINMALLKVFADLTSDPRFTKSLVDYYEKYGNLSPKQIYRAALFWQEINSQGEDSSSVSKEDLKIEDEEELDAFSFIEMFDKAAKELKYPAAVYHLTPEEVINTIYRIHFFRTGSKSKVGEGAIGIRTPVNKAAAEYQYIAVILRSGKIKYQPFFKNNTRLKELIERIVTNPKEEFAINGKKFCFCCFCGRDLDTKESIFAGYGPICADKYGLPWGDVPEDKIIVEI